MKLPSYSLIAIKELVMKGHDFELCPICDFPLEYKTQVVLAEYKGKEYSYSQPGMWCDECGEGFLSSKDLDYQKKKELIKRGLLIICWMLMKLRSSEKYHNYLKRKPVNSSAEDLWLFQI